MADDGFFREELGRRTIQIQNLREDMEAEREHLLEVQDRTQQLIQAIEKRRQEIDLRNIKAGELEDLATYREERGQDNLRLLAADRTAGVAEVARMRQELAELDQRAARAQEEVEEANRLEASWSNEVAMARGQLLTAQQAVTRAREQAAQAHIDKEERQARLTAQRCQEMAERHASAEQALRAASGKVAAARSAQATLENELTQHRETTKQLRAELESTTLEHKQIAEDCLALEEELKQMEAQAEEEKLEEALAVSRQECQYLAQDVANAKRHSLMQTQQVQGALDETRRMMTDHIDQTQRHLDQTQRADSSLSVLVKAIEEARGRAVSSAAAQRRLEEECQALEAEVRKAEEALAAERERADRQRKLADLQADIALAHGQLDAANARAEAAARDAREAEASVAEAQRTAATQAAFLRSKLEELWAALRERKPSAPFVPPLRGLPSTRGLLSQKQGIGSGGGGTM